MNVLVGFYLFHCVNLGILFYSFVNKVLFFKGYFCNFWYFYLMGFCGDNAPR